MAVRGTRGCDVRQIEVELHVLALCPSAATVAALVESWIGTDAAVLDLAGRVTTSVDRAVGAVRTLLDGAFGCMADEGTREAARIMWSIVDGAEGDRPYKQRQVEAAKRLFMSYENFRPRGTRGHYLVVRAELARALIAAAHPPGPDLPPSSPGAATTTSLPSFGRSAPAARRRGRRGLIVAVAAAIILSVAGSMLGSGDDRAAIPGDGTCRHMIGEPAKDLAREHVERLAMVEAQLVELSAPGACPAGAVSLHHDVLIQELLTPDGRRDGAITVSAHGVVVRLPEPVYAGFLEIRLGNPAEAARRAGAPLAVTAGEPMVVVLELGGVLISPTAAGPFFWVPQEGMAMRTR